MRDLRDLYGSYQPLGELPPLPPVSHLELGRQEPFCFPDRRRDPFEGATNACLCFAGPAEPVTIESVAQAMDALIEAVGPLPYRPPLFEPDRIQYVGLDVGPSPALSIYWIDSRGRTRGPYGEVL